MFRPTETERVNYLQSIFSNRFTFALSESDVNLMLVFASCEHIVKQEGVSVEGQSTAY